MKLALTLILAVFVLLSCKKNDTPPGPKPIDNNALQGKWVLSEIKAANGDTSKPSNMEDITFSLPNQYLKSRNGLPIDKGTYSFSTGVVPGGETKNVIIFSSATYPNGNSNVIELTGDTLSISDFVTYNAKTSIYTR
jgi:hypothetical protein